MTTLGKRWAFKMSPEQLQSAINEIRKAIMILAKCPNDTWETINPDKRTRGLLAVAQALGIHRVNIYHFLQGKYYMAPRHVQTLYQLTQGNINKAKIRP